MENQEQNQRSGDIEQTEQGQGSSGMEQQGGASEETDTNQNDIAGNAGGNEQYTPGNGGESSDLDESETGSGDMEQQDESIPSDGTMNEEDEYDGDDLNDIETDDDDELSAP